MKILIIEDEDIKYNHIKNYLNKLGETNITRKISRNGALKHIADKYDNNESYDLTELEEKGETEEFKILFKNSRGYILEKVNYVEK